MILYRTLLTHTLSLIASLRLLFIEQSVTFPSVNMYCKSQTCNRRKYKYNTVQIHLKCSYLRHKNREKVLDFTLKQKKIIPHECLIIFDVTLCIYKAKFEN